MLTFKLTTALAIYITSLFAANTIGIKLMPFVWGSDLSVAVFSFPVVFLMTDIIGEVYGKQTARMFVWAGFCSILAFLVYTVVSDLMPWSERSLWIHDSYKDFFGVTGTSIRFSIASLVAFIIAEYQDVVSFFFFKAKIGSRLFWLRSNLSNLWSQLLDTTVFMFIAFAGIYSVPQIVMLIWPWWLYKVLMGALYTPLSYVGIYLLRK